VEIACFTYVQGGVIKRIMATNRKTVEGIYRDGKVELLETPGDLEDARVLVTFLTGWSS